MEDGLFPNLPDDLSSLTDEQLSALLAEHKVALDKVEAEDPSYIGSLSAEDVLAQMESGVDQIKQIKAEQSARKEAGEAYTARKAELAAAAREGETDDGGDDSDDDDEEVVAEEEVEVLAAEEQEDDDSGDEEGDEEEALVEEPIAVAASVEPARKPARQQQQQARQVDRLYRRVPPPAPERQAPQAPESRTVIVAASGVPGIRAGVTLDRVGFADALIETVKRQARPKKHAGGVEERTLIAAAEFDFPAERTLTPNDPAGNTAKIRKIGNPFLGVESERALLASGGLCAPLTPLYDIPDFAVTDRPVRDALPSFRAERGGVSVPSVSTIGSITTAITVIEEEEDALGGTFATKSCQDQDCPTWTDVALGIISHCREYGNLNARAWPEGIAHENNLTLAAHARTAETRLLDRIKSLSLNVTTTQTYNAVFEMIYAVGRAAAGIRYRLRLNREVRLRALMPEWILDLLVADLAASQNAGDRFVAKQQIIGILNGAGVSPAFYLDDVTGGTSQGFADEVTSSTLDGFPTVAQWALYVEGAFLHLDGGVLELGLVRDSTLNSTNDYQVFGETFENVARIGPTQGALWVSSTICPKGTFPALQTALSC